MLSIGGDSSARIIRPSAIDRGWWQCSTTPKSTSSEALRKIGISAGKSQERGKELRGNGLATYEPIKGHPREDPSSPATVAPPPATIRARRHPETMRRDLTNKPPLEPASPELSIAGNHQKILRLVLLAGADYGHRSP
ncbi:hypothetical protein PanWU01x14_189890 [Parasponia andersonii]|uniref:Uncharacterized protein n=1 Tax=Parasponia andersonii TaxID=3476 RepID=A0A2P5C2L0_PARAD|nr:hypothetical protein PanWU01x14_189890 [Parasponia andersonii]